MKIFLYCRGFVITHLKLLLYTGAVSLQALPSIAHCFYVHSMYPSMLKTSQSIKYCVFELLIEGLSGDLRIIAALNLLTFVSAKIISNFGRSLDCQFLQLTLFFIKKAPIRFLTLLSLLGPRSKLNQFDMNNITFVE